MAPSKVVVESLRRPTVTFQTTYVNELTKSTVRAIQILMAAEGYKVTSQERMKKSIDNIIDVLHPLSDGQAVKAVKYLTAIYLPRLLGDVEPERPDFLSQDATLFASEFGRYIGRLLATKYSTDIHYKPSKRSLALAVSILQIKRYLPALPNSLRKEAVIGCRDRLTRVRKTPQSILDQVHRTATELFPEGWDGQHVPSFSVTNKSCLESARGEGGAQSFQFTEEFKMGAGGRHLFSIEEDTDTKETPYQAIRRRILELETPTLVRRPALKKNRTLSEISEASFTSASTELHSMDEFGMERRCHPNMIGRDTYWRKALETIPSQLCAKIEIVEDPLKARVITKNNWHCTILKPLQKLIHSRLRAHESFELIGTPITPEIVKRVQLGEGSGFVSGDYEAATDNLHADCTEIALRAILGNMRGPLTHEYDFMYLASKSLTNLSIYHEETGWFEQTNGQLMGSLLSFPILCLINFAVWRFVTEMKVGRSCDGRGKGGRYDHVLINGDDILFAATPDHYTLWKNNVPLVGLSPSMGKNYYSPHFAMVNSRSYVPRCTIDGGWHMSPVPFVNLGLLLSPDIDTIENNEASVEALGPMHDEFVDGCEDRRMASGLFIKEHEKLLKTTFRNLFGPRKYGALGAHPVHGTKGDTPEGYDVRQLFIAKLLKEGKVKLPRAGVTSNYSRYTESYIKKRFPHIVEESVDLLEIAPEGYHWEDVSERVGEVRANVLSFMSWLGPLNIRRRSVNDRAWLRRVMRSIDAKKIEMSVDCLNMTDFLTFPEETGIFQLVLGCDRPETDGELT